MMKILLALPNDRGEYFYNLGLTNLGVNADSSIFYFKKAIPLVERGKYIG
jgi:hypothetical protein